MRQLRLEPKPRRALAKEINDEKCPLKVVSLGQSSAVEILVQFFRADNNFVNVEGANLMNFFIYFFIFGAFVVSILSVFRGMEDTEETLSEYSFEISEGRLDDLNVRLADLKTKLTDLENRATQEMSQDAVAIGPLRSPQQIALERLQGMEATVEGLLSKKIEISRDLGQTANSDFRGKVSNLYLQRVSNESLPEKERVMALQMVRGVSNELPDDARTFALGVLNGSIDATSQLRVLRLISGIDDERFVEPLMRFLRSANSSMVREEAAESLSTFARKSNIVFKALKLASRADISERVRLQAMKSTSREMGK